MVYRTAVVVGVVSDMCSDSAYRVSKDFYELCFRQYEFEKRETDQIYQRVSIVLVFLSLLASVIVRLGRIDILELWFVRVDVFLYYSAIVLALACLAVSVGFAILFVVPRRRKYMDLATMKAWQQWRREYNDYYERSKGSAREDNDEDAEPSEEFFHRIADKLAEAQSNNAPINEKRRQYFHLCVLTGACGMIPMAVEALFYMLLKVQGV